MTPDWVLLNGAAVRGADARISPLSEGFQFGLGAFETMRLRGGRIASFPAHAARLRQAAETLGVDWQPGPDLLSRCLEAAERNGLGDAAVKLACFQDLAGAGEIIVARRFPYASADYERGFRLQARRGGGAPLAAIKALSYAANLLARRAARAAECDDVLWLGPAEEALEGAATNLFIVEDGRLSTPPADGRILPGIARAGVLGLGPVRQETLPLARVLAADEVFVTNALIGVMPVVAIDARQWPAPSAASVTMAWRNRYEGMLSG